MPAALVPALAQQTNEKENILTRYVANTKAHSEWPQINRLIFIRVTFFVVAIRWA